MTLPGNMIFGPPIALASLIVQESRRIRATPFQVARDWLPHLIAVALLLVWLDDVGLSLGRYILLIVYPGMALTTVRAHAEHRADAATQGRAATVERGGALALLFLNNNLHAAHHEWPQLAWYVLPTYHRRHRARLIGDGAVLYAGYGTIAQRFAWRTLAITPASPNLLFVTSMSTPIEPVAALQTALAQVLADPDLASARTALFLAGETGGSIERFAPLIQLERDAARAGYPDLR